MPFFIGLLIKSSQGASGRLLVAPRVFLPSTFSSCLESHYSHSFHLNLLGSLALNTSVARKEFADCFGNGGPIAPCDGAYVLVDLVTHIIFQSISQECRALVSCLLLRFDHHSRRCLHVGYCAVTEAESLSLGHFRPPFS